MLEGLGQGVTMPAMYTFLSKWSPPQERSMLVAFVLAGGKICFTLVERIILKNKVKFVRPFTNYLFIKFVVR